MIVNGKKYDINELMKDINFNAKKMVKVGAFYLTNEEIEILDRNCIDYKSASSLKDLIMIIQKVLEDGCLDTDEGDELDYVLEQISDRDYYQNSQK